MEFATEEEMKTFLAGWLEAHGHTVYRDIKCPDGGKVDILTQDYAVACCHWLTPTALVAAMEELIACEADIAQHRPVVAGLTPSAPNEDDASTGDETPTILAELNAAGIEVWFLDQVQVLQDYYQQGPTTLEAPPPRLPKHRQPWNPWAGVTVALGMAAILALSFTLAYRILQEPTAQTLTPEQQDAWDQLHNAARVWDIETAQRQLRTLQRSRNSCLTKFANRFQTTLESQGSEGFREINPIKRALNQQEGCDLELVIYEFSP